MELNDFQKGVDLLVKANKEFRESEQVKELKKICSLYNFATQFCTIHISSNRRCGKSEYIRMKATKYDLIIVAFKGLIEICFPADQTQARVVAASTPLQLKKIFESEDDIGFENIYIDEPTAVFKEVDRDLLCSNLTKTGDETFILLGE